MCTGIICDEEKEAIVDVSFSPYEIEYSNRLKKSHIKKQRQAYEEAEINDNEIERMRIEDE